MNILSWNVNSLRARYNNGHLDWLLKEKPDIFCIQETKASEDQIRKIVKGFDDYHAYFSSSTLTPGYSGVAIYSKTEPFKVTDSFGDGKFMEEGRILKAEFDDFILFNIYFPTGTGTKENLEHKFEFYELFLKNINKLQSDGHHVLVCGDFNIAHKPVDLSYPKRNSAKPGFLSHERAFLDKIVEYGYFDTFRLFNKEANNYTWWSYGHNLRDRNIGMRLDHFFATENLKDNIKAGYTCPEIMGSDHCPIGVEIHF